MHLCKTWQWSQLIWPAILSYSTCAQPSAASDTAFDEMTVVTSPVDGNITISYKSPPPDTCNTVFSTQRQFTGYVTLPPDVSRPSQGNYTINTFFWFVEARQVPESAPLSIFINGGPGSSSMVGMFQEVGPCEVVELARNKLGTVAREWGWDRSSSMLFLDQPVQTGFSYDNVTQASLNLLDESLVYPPTSRPNGQPAYTYLNGTFSSDSPLSTANTSQIAAQAVWHFLQGFISTFPEYNSALAKGNPVAGLPMGVNLFTESYGGKFAPAIGSFFQKQNQLRQTDPVFANTTMDINLKTLGIINGWVDLLIQAPFYARYAYNNSYSIQAISQVQELNALSSYSGAGGCEQMTISCRTQQITSDPEDTGANIVVNDACSKAQSLCQAYLVACLGTSGRSVYDISQYILDPFPSPRYLDYLNNEEVQQAIGVPVNYTQTSTRVNQAFYSTGDYARDGAIQDIVDLLNAGVRVAFIYGDRDFICNWQGGEAISFAVAAAAGPAYLDWYSAGYTPIVTNDTYIGGVVKEYGHLSFSRIYDSGHLVPAYQPETAFTVFSRIIQGTNIGMGLPTDLSTYKTSGEANSTYQNSAPPAASPKCFLRAVNSTCNTDHRNMLANGAGVIINGALYNSEGDWQAPDPEVVASADYPASTASNGAPTPTPQSGTTSSPSTTRSGTTRTGLATGVYTATTIPSVTSTSSRNEATNFKSELFKKDTPQVAALLALGLWTYEIV